MIAGRVTADDRAAAQVCRQSSLAHL